MITVLGDQRIQMRLQRREDYARLHVRKLDSPTTERSSALLVIEGRGSAKIGSGSGRGSSERGPQLIHRGNMTSYA